MKITVLAAALLFLAGEAAACGYCVEDKIAATYDHAVVTRALARGHHVVFFHVEGSPPARRVLEAALSSVAGVDPGSARISPDLLSVSLSFNPRRASLAAITERLERKLKARKLSLLPLRVMERPADLTSVKR